MDRLRPEELTAANLDKSNLLEILIKQKYSAQAEDILGELQVRLACLHSRLYQASAKERGGIPLHLTSAEHGGKQMMHLYYELSSLSLSSNSSSPVMQDDRLPFYDLKPPLLPTLHLGC